MKVSVVRLAGVERSVTVEVDAETVAGALEATAREFARGANIPGGYRKPQAKLARVKQMLRKEIAEEATARLVSESLPHALEEQKLKAVGMPRMLNHSTPAAGQVFTYTALVEVSPEIPAPRYKGLAVPVFPVTVSNEDVDEKIEALRKQAARYVPLTEGGLADGCTATISLAPRTPNDDVRTRLARKEAMVYMNEYLCKEPLRTALTGKRVGDRFSVEAPVGAMPLGRGDHGDAAYVWDVEVTTAQVQQLPPADDQFAMQVRGLSSMLALRGDVRDELREEREREARLKADFLLGEALIEENPFDIPHHVVRNVWEDRLDALREGFRRRWGKMSEEAVNQLVEMRSREELDGAYRETALYFIQESIATAEGVSVTDEEVSAKLGELAAQEGVSAEDLRKKAGASGLDSVRAQIRTSKVMKVVESFGVKEDGESVMRRRHAGRQRRGMLRQGHLNRSIRLSRAAVARRNAGRA